MQAKLPADPRHSASLLAAKTDGHNVTVHMPREKEMTGEACETQSELGLYSPAQLKETALFLPTQLEVTGFDSSCRWWWVPNIQAAT